MPSPFNVDVVPQAPEDPLFGLMAAYKADTFDKKVDLGIGAYRDDNAKPWVLPVVKKVCTTISCCFLLQCVIHQLLLLLLLLLLLKYHSLMSHYLGR